MTTNALSLDPTQVNRDVNLLAPLFYRRVQIALIECRSQGLNLHVFEGYRTPQRQAWLYAQGRSRDGKIVTMAKEWESWHNFGLAVDVVFKDEAGKWTWKGDYSAVEKCFVKQGLQRGPKFEHAHFELTGGLDIQIALGLYKSVGLQAVWAEAMAKLPVS